jgi:hypothetical protein
MDLASRARLTELWACRNRSAASIDSAYVSLKEWERGSSEAHKLEAFTIIECSLGFECSMSRWNLVHEAAGWRGRIDARPRDRRDKRLWMDHKCISGALVQTSLAEDLVRRRRREDLCDQGSRLQRLARRLSSPLLYCRCCWYSSTGRHTSPAQMGVIWYDGQAGTGEKQRTRQPEV